MTDRPDVDAQALAQIILKKDWVTDPVPDWLLRTLPEEIARALHRVSLERAGSELDITEKALALQAELVRARRRAVDQALEILDR